MSLANAINKQSKNFYNITTFHNFHDEVDVYRTHIWQCDGPCLHQPPYFGLVKRAMNRPPGPSDAWFRNHTEYCGGTFTKIAGPEPKEKEKGKQQKNKILGWLKKGSQSPIDLTEDTPKPTVAGPSMPPPASGGRKRPRTADTMDRENSDSRPASSYDDWKEKDEYQLQNGRDQEVLIMGSRRMIICPICVDKVWEDEINRHLDNDHGL